MANDCSYTMKIIGSHDDLVEFISWVKAHYNYAPDRNEPFCSAKHHFYRVFSADVCWKNENEVYIYGYCAWSVACCFTAEGYCKDEEKLWGALTKGITLAEATKLLHLQCEVYSTESMCGFAEHYRYDYGVEKIYDSSDYKEIYLADFLYETKEEIEELYEIQITDKQWKSRAWICNCDWDTENLTWTI